MNDKEKIKLLERQIELLEQIIKLQEKINTPSVPYPVYPSYPPYWIDFHSTPVRDPIRYTITTGTTIANPHLISKE